MSAAGVGYRALYELDQIRPARRLRLTRRGEWAAALGLLASIFGVSWGASALGYLLTGVPG